MTAQTQLQDLWEWYDGHSSVTWVNIVFCLEPFSNPNPLLAATSFLPFWIIISAPSFFNSFSAPLWPNSHFYILQGQKTETTSSNDFLVVTSKIVVSFDLFPTFLCWSFFSGYGGIDSLQLLHFLCFHLLSFSFLPSSIPYPKCSCSPTLGPQPSSFLSRSMCFPR